MILKISGTVICFSIFVIGGYSQYSHKFGEVSAREIDMKECAFDPQAPAVLLLNEGFADHDDQYHLLTNNHRRIKILNERGIKNADIGILFQSDDQFEYIDDIEAVTINIDGGGRKEYPIDRKSIYTKKFNQYFSEVKFAFPEVKVGSILEYTYRSVKRSCTALRDWNFQSRLPVCFSSFELRPFPTIEFTYQIRKSPKYQAIIKPSIASNTTYFEMDNLPGLGEEPYMDSREDYLQKVIFTVTKFEGGAGIQNYMTSWNEVARELWGNPYFGPEIRANIKEPQDIIASAVSGKTDQEKMAFIYDFVRKNTQWNGIYSRYAIDGVRTVWNKKTGASGSINLLMVNLMRNAGLEAYPLLVSERGKGKINVKTPFVNQFDNVYAVAIIKGKKYYLDATEGYTPAYLIPFNILNTTALIVKNKSGELVDIEESGRRYRENIYFSADLSSDGKLSALVQSVSKDYAQQQKIKNYNSDKDKYIENYIKKNISNVSIDSLEVSKIDNDSSDFVQKFKLNMQLQSTGDYSFLGLNLFSGFEEDPFTINERFSNVNFGYMENVNLSWLVKVPANWGLESLPKNMKMVNPDHSVIFSREIVYNKETSQLSARIKIELNKSLFNVEEYPDLKLFFKKMTDILNEQIVFKTK